MIRISDFHLLLLIYGVNMLFFLGISLLWANEFIVDISDEMDLGISGTWGIPFYNGDRWWLAMGHSSDLWVAPFDVVNWGVDMPTTRNLSNIGLLSDHSFRQCPDGTYLHVSNNQPGDPNYLFHYAHDFSLIAQQTFPHLNPPEYAPNDVPAICGDTFKGFGLAQAQGEKDYFVHLDDDLNWNSPIELPSSPRLTGAGLIEVDDKLIAVGMDPGPGVTISVYDANFQLESTTQLNPYLPEIIHHWPSRIKKVGDYFVMAMMGRSLADQFPLDTGDLYLLVTDADFHPVEWHQVSFNNPSEDGGMRPWFDIHDDQIVLSYDKANSIYFFSATLNLPAFNSNPTTEPSHEELSDTGDENNIEKTEGCGRNALGLYLLPWFLRRKKPPSVQIGI